jgi:hypothetical protein
VGWFGRGWGEGGVGRYRIDAGRDVLVVVLKGVLCANGS